MSMRKSGNRNKESKIAEHPGDCQCGNHKAHNIKFDKTKTAEHVENYIAPLHPREECASCKANIRQQVIEEIDPYIHNILYFAKLNDNETEKQKLYESWWQTFKGGE